MNIEEKITDLSYMTGVINTMARSDKFDLCYTVHCKERMAERGISVSDVLFALKYGMIKEYQGLAKHRNEHKIHKYLIVSSYLEDDSGDREIGIVILVQVDRLKNPAIKLQDIITTMWRDKQ